MVLVLADGPWSMARGAKAKPQDDAFLFEDSSAGAETIAARCTSGCHMWFRSSERKKDAFLLSIFKRCDINGDGQISKIELIKLLQADREVADFFGLPYHIR